MKMKKHCIGWGQWEYPKRSWIDRLIDAEDAKPWEKWFNLGAFLLFFVVIIFCNT